MGIIYVKSIRKFKNNQNTIFEILKKANNHYFLTERKENEAGARTIRTTKMSILYFLMDEYKKNGLKEL